MIQNVDVYMLKMFFWIRQRKIARLWEALMDVRTLYTVQPTLQQCASLCTKSAGRAKVFAPVWRIVHVKHYLID
jgi:hypothetical protein